MVTGQSSRTESQRQKSQRQKPEADTHALTIRQGAIFSVPGIDAIFVGPNDLAASMRGKDGKGPSAEATAQALKHVLATCRKHKVAAKFKDAKRAAGI